MTSQTKLKSQFPTGVTQEMVDAATAYGRNKGLDRISFYYREDGGVPKPDGSGMKDLEYVVEIPPSNGQEFTITELRQG